MTSDPFYRNYVSNPDLARRYEAYQNRYSGQIRESDKILIEKIRELHDGPLAGRRPLRLLDIGCSTGNLLRHLRKSVDGLQLTGGDLMESHLDACRRDPELNGVGFERIDATRIGVRSRYDIITTVAVLYMFNDPEFESALASIVEALSPGGWFLAFDFFHPFEQDLTILEKSRSHPNGLPLHFRPYRTTLQILERCGFQEPEFSPFAIPVDLPRNQPPATDGDGFEDLNTYTVRTEAAERLQFRGALFQPWCHLASRKPG